MNKVLLKGVLISMLLILLSLICMYLGLAYYYRDGFSYNTWINGVYCTGKTMEEVNRELQSASGYEGLTIMDSDGRSYTISSKEVSLDISYADPLRKFKEQQNPLLWIDNMIGNRKEHELLPVMTYNEDVFEQKLAGLPFMTGRKPEDRRVEIVKDEKGYGLIQERIHVLNEERAAELIRTCFKERQDTLELEAAGCYEDLPLTEQMKETIALFAKLEAFQSCGIIYMMGEEELPIDSSITCDFMLLDENGGFVFDENGELIVDREQTDAFIDRLAQEYDTVGITRNFQASNGKTVAVEGGTYGNQLDTDAEKEYLYEAFVTKKAERHEPAYLQKACCQGRDDIGNTYIEVDMGNQKLYYYENGVLQIETDVVTGNMALRRSTPAGTYYVYNKQKNRVLRGADYATPVKYWIPVYKAIGIHDASWRKSFGGEIYLTNGSHGCVNTPTEEVAALYDMVEIGTPCILFY